MADVNDMGPLPTEADRGPLTVDVLRAENEELRRLLAEFESLRMIDADALLRWLEKAWAGANRDALRGEGEAAAASRGEALGYAMALRHVRRLLGES